MNRQWYYPDEIVPPLGCLCWIEVEYENDNDIAISTVEAAYTPFGWDADLFNDYPHADVIKWTFKFKGEV